ncbi:MAG: DUF692 family protein [Myxococcales bacterium]|nr:DUF692 family protein [Myxococcales bacterium]
MTQNRWNLPNLGLGLGLRGPHIASLLRQPHPEVQWLEVVTDNYLIHQGWLRRVLHRLREHYPIVLHGVTLNLGSTDPLDVEYVRKIKALADEIGAPWVSDHLCWTGVDGLQSHDLLPVPYTQQALGWTAARIRQVQDILERPLVLENPSTYVAFVGDELTEWQFVAELAEQADCGLLLDVNNIHVAAHNHGFDAQSWLRSVPWSRVCQFHVAGHTTYATHKLDTHIGPVPAAVWQLYAQAWALSGGRATLLEWDDQIPPLDVAVAEMTCARQHQDVHVATSQTPTQPKPKPAPRQEPKSAPRQEPKSAPLSLHATYVRFMQRIVTGEPDGQAGEYVLPCAQLQPDSRLAIHAKMYPLRLSGALTEDFPKTASWLGPAFFATVCAEYIQAYPSRHWALELFGRNFARFLRQRLSTLRMAADVAELEWQCIEAKLTAVEDRSFPIGIAGVSGEVLGRSQLKFAEGSRTVEVQRRVWRQYSGQLVGGRGAVHVRISSRGATVVVQAMELAQWRLWTALKQGLSVLQACETVARRWPRFATEIATCLPIWLHDWAADGAVVGVIWAGAERGQTGASPDGQAPDNH